MFLGWTNVYDELVTISYPSADQPLQQLPAEPESPPAAELAAATNRLRHHLLGIRPDQALWGWLGPLIIMLVGGFLRFWNLGTPDKLIFDETYYAKQGSSFLDFGYERSINPKLGDKVDDLFTKGNPDIWGQAPDFVVHPPVGKWMIAAGEAVFGQSNPIGWRFASAVVGTLSIFMIARIARRLFGSTLLGCIAGLLLAVEGHHFVHSRTALLDVFVMFWALAAFGALLVDRDQARASLAPKIAALKLGSTKPDRLHNRISGVGPLLWWRPWRVLAGVCLGLCCGTKWSGLYFVIGFGLLTVLWDVGARRAAGVQRWLTGGLAMDGALGFAAIVPTAIATYLVSWAGWFKTQGGWGRQWGAQHPSESFSVIPDAVRSLWHYHQEMYTFHVGLSSFHSYQSNPWSWIIQGRPTSFFYESSAKGEGKCTAAQCSSAITSLGTPLIWWGAVFAIFTLLIVWLGKRDWRAGAILCGITAGYLPWFAFQERTIYTFYAVAFVPWLVLALVYVIGMAIGPAQANPRRRMIGGGLSGAFVVACVVMFFFFWPVYTAQVIPYGDWSLRMWLPSWV